MDPIPICYLCNGQTFLTWSAFMTHNRIAHRGNRLRCGSCSNFFRYSDQLDSHIQAVHGGSSEEEDSSSAEEDTSEDSDSSEEEDSSSEEEETDLGAAEDSDSDDDTVVVAASSVVASVGAADGTSGVVGTPSLSH